jgi:Flp pilus assembly protein TadG
MRRQTRWKGHREGESGVAAIEFALILPLLLTLSLGMLDITAAISAQRALTYAANVMSDLVTQQAPKVTAAEIDDFFRAAEIAVRGGAASPNVTVRVLGYGLDAQGGAQLKWSRSNGGSEGCSAPAAAGLGSLMTGPNDVVVAVVCTRHNVVAAQLIGPLLGGSSILLEEQIVLRPREFQTIDCTDC